MAASFVFPAAVFYTARRKSRNPTAAAALRVTYREEYSYYESVLMARRLVFILLATFIQGQQRLARAFARQLAMAVQRFRYSLAIVVLTWVSVAGAGLAP